MNNENNNQSSMVLGNVENIPSANQVQNNTIPNNNVSNNGVQNSSGNINNDNMSNMAGNQVMTGNVIEPVPNPQVENLNSNVSPTNIGVPSNNGINNNIGTVMDGSNIPLQEPTPQTQTPPAYTNPETINQNQSNNFQPQGSIGMTPPVSLEPEKQPKKKTNKILFVIIIIIVLIGIGFGTYYVLNYTNLLVKKEEINIETKNIEINIGETLPENINEYATITGTNTSNCNPVDATEVDVNQEGTYEYTITCGDVSKKGKVTVIDNIEIVAETKTVYKTKGSALSASEFAMNSNDGLKYDFASQSDVDTALNNTSGTYNIGLKISKGVKTVDATGKLVMLEYPIRGYVTCEANSQIVSAISASKVVAEKFAILDDERKNSYAGIGYEITTFTFNDETTFKTYQNEYNDKKTITIDGVTGYTEFSTNESGQSVIKITKELDNSDVLLQYGAENMQDYSSIMKYFGKTANGLGYVCTYQKAE